MRGFHSAEPPLELDACKPCGVVWFDPREFEAIPEGAAPAPDPMNARMREALALHKVEQIAERARLEDPSPDESWKTIPALFGFPVETETSRVARWPWATWSLAALILAVSLWAFADLARVADRFGSIPAQFWRLGGLTMLTSFFLHADGMHLISNLYFLLVFGDNVEDYLGRWRYLALILLAALAGDALHAAAQPHSTAPAIGASGGISGILAFYALEFPRARLGFLLHYIAFFRIYLRWIQIPAWGAFVLWCLLQLALACLQMGGYSNVAALAHLGGAGVGALAWRWWRRTPPGSRRGVRESALA